MERYCGFLKRDGVRNRRKPYASLDNRVRHVAQLNITKIRYNLVDLLSLTGSRKEDGDMFPERACEGLPVFTMCTNPNICRPPADTHAATEISEAG